VGSVLEYCYSGMTKTHMIRLERVQYSGIRIAGTHVFDPKNSVGVLSGIAPLAERFVYLYFRYFVAVFYRRNPEEAEFGSLYSTDCGRWL
jgi:hypothetical protein